MLNLLSSFPHTFLILAAAEQCKYDAYLSQVNFARDL